MYLRGTYGQLEDWQNGPPRKLAEPHGTWRGANRRALRPQIRHFRVFDFAPLGPPPPPFPNTRRFGGFETPGIGRWAEYRIGGKGHRAKWAAAELGGIPRIVADPRGTPQEANYALESAYFSRFLRTFELLVPPHPSPFPNNQRFGGFETPGIGWWADYRIEEKGQRAQWPPRNLAELRGTMGDGKTGKMGSRGNWRNPTEPDGTPRNTQMTGLPTQILHFPAFSSISPLPFPHFLPSPNISVVSKRWVLGFFRKIGAAARKDGGNGPLRNPTEPDGT